MAIKIKDENDTFDMKKVTSIVDRIKKKYKAEGTLVEEPTEYGELKGIITGTKSSIKVQTAEELKNFKSPIINKLGSLYLSLSALTKPLGKLIEKLKFSNSVGFYLYSANMPYSAQQWIALTAIVSLISTGIMGLLSLVLIASMKTPNFMLLPLVLLGSLAISMIVMLIIPKQAAQTRSQKISAELPFALRHMSTELRAGISFYRTIETIATADYGILSEEFARARTEIEEGTDTKEALRHLALRTQSKALRNAIMHMIRALKTGGNLSNIMEEIANDVSFEIQMKIRDFSQKMNFFGVIFIFLAIILPVFIGILGGIRNTPLPSASLSSIPLTTEMIAFTYLVLMPLILIMLFIYVRAMQPKV
ncbi:MAG: type II secretion system F family protein [archaeon]|mgnify:CR=1 FL=1